MIVLDVFERHTEDLKEGFLDDEGKAKGKKQVPVSAVLGHEISAGTAATVARAIAQLQKRDEIDTADQALDLLASNFLAAE